MKTHSRMCLCVLSLPMMLAACATSDTVAPVKVREPAECDRLLKEVAPPAVKVGDDIRVVTANGAVTIRLQNARIKAARECLAAQRRKYSEAK